MEEVLIGGIQQLGVGVRNVDEGFAWFRRAFGTDLPVFREAATAPLMTRYTEGVVPTRDALLAVNTAGGGGFEIWQHTGKEPSAPSRPVEIGDYGLLAGRIKARGISQAYQYLQSIGADVRSPARPDPSGNSSFVVVDPWGNHFVVAESDEWFRRPDTPLGGVSGAVIGVSDMAASLDFYATVLGYDQKRYDETGQFDDLVALPGGDRTVRRALISRSVPPKGPFATLFGPSRLELVSVPGHEGMRAFDGRWWGDLGFIHLCYDVVGMDALAERCEGAGHPFTVDSGTESFEMGEAGGRFAYVEDPDGTLIEFVETHKVPVLKKLNWYLDLRKRPRGASLPNWMIRAMGFGRVRG